MARSLSSQARMYQEVPGDAITDEEELLQAFDLALAEAAEKGEKDPAEEPKAWWRSGLFILITGVAALAALLLFSMAAGGMRYSRAWRGTGSTELWPKPAFSKPCAGELQVNGLGTVYLVNAKYNLPGDPAGNVWMEDSKVVLTDKGRTYWGNACPDPKGSHEFRQSDYTELYLLNKRLEYTMDLRGADCGCNAAFYLVSMSRSEWPTNCEDYYCDAMNICGATCLEIDLQEANLHAFHSTFHDFLSQTAPGIGTGGGSTNWMGPRDFSAWQYGINASCINTRMKYRVSVEFPVYEGTEELKSIDIRLSQNGCSVQASAAKLQASMPVLSAEMRKGMTPVMSYWRSWRMGWLDGNGPGEGAFCTAEQDANGICSDTVAFSDFSVTDLAPEKWSGV